METALNEKDNLIVSLKESEKVANVQVKCIKQENDFMKEQITGLNAEVSFLNDNIAGMREANNLQNKQLNLERQNRVADYNCQVCEEREKTFDLIRNLKTENSFLRTQINQYRKNAGEL